MTLAAHRQEIPFRVQRGGMLRYGCICACSILASSLWVSASIMMLGAMGYLTAMSLRESLLAGQITFTGSGDATIVLPRAHPKRTK